MSDGARPEVAIGVVGAGMMADAVVDAASRWRLLVSPPGAPRLRVLCDVDPARLERLAPAFERTAADWRAVVAARDVSLVYVAVPHHLHREIAVAAIEAGKDVLVEKPMGLDLGAAEAIAAAAAARPGQIVHVSNEFPFHPAAVHARDLVARRAALGAVPFQYSGWHLHGSDVDPKKPINWKRQSAFCGPGGVLSDLGAHVFWMASLLGFRATRVSAALGKFFRERPKAAGSAETAPCDTWDKALLLAHCDNGALATFRADRVATGVDDSWGFRAEGIGGVVGFDSERRDEALHFDRQGGGSGLAHVPRGSRSIYPIRIGDIFGFGFRDVLLQMWAAVVEACATRSPSPHLPTAGDGLYFQRVTDAALRSHAAGAWVAVGPGAA